MQPLIIHEPGHENDNKGFQDQLGALVYYLLS